MKLAKALSILGLDRLPQNEDELNAAYKVLAKKLHPDTGGSEEAFQELGEAVEYIKRAIEVLTERSRNKENSNNYVTRKRAVLREQMLRQRAEEDRLRNQHAQKWIIGFLVVLTLFGLWLFFQPKINHWMVEKNRVEQMAEVVRIDYHNSYTIAWTHNGQRYEKEINGRFIDGIWIVGPAGMPILPGAKFIVAFNGDNPDYFEVLDQFIHTETAEKYFSLVKRSLSQYLQISENAPQVECLYWRLLDEYGVDGIAHLHFRELPMRKNWSHNQSTFNAIAESARFKELYRSCLLP